MAAERAKKASMEVRLPAANAFITSSEVSSDILVTEIARVRLIVGIRPRDVQPKSADDLFTLRSYRSKQMFGAEFRHQPAFSSRSNPRPRTVRQLLFLEIYRRPHG